MRTIVFCALSLMLALPAVAGESAARKANPDVAESLDGILTDVADWSSVAERCGDDPCASMKAEAAAIEEGLESLWGVIGSPEGKRAEVDAAYKSILEHSDAFERWMPQAEIADLDTLCRRWTQTREKIDRFKRTMRQLSS
jgi:hypothetical protein